MKSHRILGTAAVALALTAVSYAPPASAGAPAGKLDIVNTAKQAGSFNTLLAALKATDLTKTLRGDGPFTVFAPTDEAFAKLPAGTLESLLADPEALTQILLYHVVPGTYAAADVVGATSLAAANGLSLSISVVGSQVKVNDATVVATDVLAKNGIIHVIDTVLVPAQAR
jgi:uncharacterized surface protein with fasciclin (FAS1) repeats